MKHSYYLTVLLTAILFGSCHNSGPEAVTPLGAYSLFSKDSVRAYLNAVPADRSDSSKKIFLKALDLAKNKKNPAAATTLFLQALSLYPSATGYYELGNAWLESNNPDQALKAFDMAELMDYSPWSYVLFKKACCYGEKEDYDALSYLSYAIQNGFVDRDKIMNNTHLARLNNQEQLTSTYNEAMSGNGDPDAILWEGYSKQFGQSNFPLTIDSGTFANIGKPVTISYDYEKYVTEMRDHKFSRDVGNDFFYFTRVNDNPTFKTVIYGSHSYDGGDHVPVYYLIASFTRTGRLIDKKMIAGCHTLDEPFKECSFASNHEFEVKEYKNIFEKDTETEGYDNNRIVKRDLINTYKYNIDSTGKFIALQ